jgi:SP family sugar:H+ symporter-like MFS transporter
VLTFTLRSTGAVVASYQLMITIGILVSNLINYGVREIEDTDASWRIVIGLGIGFSIPLGVGVLFLPESPRWLAGRDDWEGARQSMARFRGLKHDPNNQLIEDDFGEMYDSIQQQKSAGVGSWLECFTGSSGKPRVVYRTLLGLGVQFLQQWTGVNYFFYVSSVSWLL